MDVIPSCYNVDRVLGLECLGWSRYDDIDHTLAERDRSSRAQELKAGKWFGVGPFCNIKNTIHLVRENFAVVSILSKCHGLLDASTLTGFIERTVKFCSEKQSCASLSKGSNKTKGCVKNK